MSTPACLFCGRLTFDPAKGEGSWARGVKQGRQVLVCPDCQAERGDWAAAFDGCVECGETRLSLMLGEIVCRACGHTMGA